jgi:hypothetical protein
LRVADGSIIESDRSWGQRKPNFAFTSYGAVPRR